MKKTALTLLVFGILLFGCSKDEEPTNTSVKIEYRITSEYANDAIKIDYINAEGAVIQNKSITPPYSIIFEAFKHQQAKIDAWRPSLSSGDLTVEIYLNNVLVASETEGRATYVANASFDLD